MIVVRPQYQADLAKAQRDFEDVEQSSGVGEEDVKFVGEIEIVFQRSRIHKRPCLPSEVFGKPDSDWLIL